MRNISNSEVVTWLSCRRQYKYAHYLNLEPKVMGTPLYRGNIGHEAFQRYTEARLDGKTHDDSLKHGLDVFTTALHFAPDRIAEILETQSLFQRYMGFHNGWPEWKLLEPEQKFEVALNDDMKMVIRYDTLVEVIRTGQRLIGDYKFTYDFWSPDDHALNGQMPKYISVMNANGQKIDGGFLEEIRTRPLGKEKSADPKNLWRRTFYYPTPAKKRNMIKQHIAAGLEILEYWDATDEERSIKDLPVLNKHGACKFCNFKDLCNSENDGKDITTDIQLGYQENSYGYNNETTEKEALELL